MAGRGNVFLHRPDRAQGKEPRAQSAVRSHHRLQCPRRGSRLRGHPVNGLRLRQGRIQPDPLALRARLMQSVAGPDDLAPQRVQHGQIVGAERDIDGGHVLLEPLHPLGTGNRDDGDAEPLPLRMHPRKGTWAGATPLASATWRTASAIAWLAAPASPEKRGLRLRKSLASSALTSTVPVRKPRPSGEYATRPTFSSRRASSTVVSGSRAHSEYSLCTAVIGCTAQARRSRSLSTSERPR